MNRLWRAIPYMALWAALFLSPLCSAQTASSEILLQRARSLESADHLDLAAQVWKQVLLSDPTSIAALTGLARYAEQQGNTKEAEQYLEKAKAIDPHATQIAKSPKAQRSPSDSTELNPDQAAKLQQAARLSADHKPEEAMRLYREVFKERPPDGKLALAYYQTLASIPAGRNEAVSRLQDLARRHPDDPRYALAAACILTYNPQTRREAIRELELLHGDPTVSEEVRSAWRQALLWEKGNPAYQPSLQRYLKAYSDSSMETEFGPSQPQRSAEAIAIDNGEQAAYRALQQGDLKEAESRFQDLSHTSATDYRTLMGLGLVRMKQERFGEAVELLEAANAAPHQKDKNLQQTLETARFWKLMQEGNSFLEQDHMEQASASFQQALLLRPDNADAIRGLAGTLMKEREYSGALPLYRRLIAINREDKDAWKSLLGALQKSGDSAGAIAGAGTMPAPVKAAFTEDAEFLVLLAAAYEATGATGESRRLMQKAIELSGTNSASTGTQLQLASLLLQVGMISQATEMYVRLAEQNSQNLDVWRGLIAALHAADKDAEALAISARMPRQSFQAATKNPDFLMLMASIYESAGQLESAHRFLEQASQIQMQRDKQISINLQLQVAGLWLREKEYSKAVELFDQVVRRNPENTDAWNGKLTALHAAHQDSEVIGEFYTMDPNLRDHLLNDPVITGLLASAYLAQGQKDVALRMIRRAAWQYESMRRPMPVDLQVQTCWILMESGEDANLTAELMALTARKDLTSQQNISVEHIWVSWSQKRSERLASLGEYRQALSVLDAARQAFPADTALRSSFANMLLRAGYTRRSFEDYASWALVGGSRDDYLSGIGAAMATHEFKSAEAWLETALRIWPDDPKVLLLGAKLAAARGDYGRANKYYQAARAASPAQQQNVDSAPGGGTMQDQNQAVKNLANVLAPADSRATRSMVPASSNIEKSGQLDELLYALPSEGNANQLSSHTSNQPVGMEAVSNHELLPWESAEFEIQGGPHASGNSNAPSQSNGANQDGSPNLFLNPGSNPPQLSNAKNVVRNNQSSRAPQSFNAPDVSDFKASPMEDPPYSSDVISTNSHSFSGNSGLSSSPHSEVQSEIDAMNAQFSPYVGMGGFVGTRSGQTGFDYLNVLGSDLEASTTLGNQTRLTAIIKPVFLDAGAPETNTTLQLGTLALGSSFPALSASGVGAEFQVATQNLGVRLGVSPQGFLINNFIGSLVFRPEGGPFQISVIRAPVRDTLLSYAGVRDPGTNQIWGGVISDGVSGTAAWNANNSGLYAQFGYQYITGDHVLTNQRYDGTAGAYWRVLTEPYGALSFGLNFSGMHYDENLRYFTFGQGGYFSPQSYFLFNVPVHWKGTYRDRFEYSVDTSFGSQHFTEDSTPYFPLEVSNAQPVVAASNPSADSLDLRPIPVVPKPKPVAPVATVIPYYPGQTVTSVNYSLILKGGYRLDRNWFAGGFVDVNNARDYTSTSAGIYVRYQPRAASLDTPLTDTYLPQIDSIRGLILP